MKTLKAIAALLPILALHGCGGGGSEATTYSITKVTPPPVTVSGTNGDVSKYLGIWISDCGTNLLEKTSAINRITFSSISGATAKGTLEVTTYKSLDCSSSTQFIPPIPQAIELTYQSNLAINTTDSQGTVFSGGADKATLRMLDTQAASSFNFGFLEGFSKFKLNSSGSFSAFDLTYTKFTRSQ